MSNNAVLCISNNNKTVRLTVYACKPAVFLMQLEKYLSAVNNFEIDELVMMLLDNGFDLDFETSKGFTPADMCTGTLVNWAWLLDIENKLLKYWDVTAALNGMQDTIEQQSISPLDYSNWMKKDAVEEYETHINQTEKKLKNIGIEIVNF